MKVYLISIYCSIGFSNDILIDLDVHKIHDVTLNIDCFWSDEIDHMTQILLYFMSIYICQTLNEKYKNKNVHAELIVNFHKSFIEDSGKCTRQHTEYRVLIIF